MSSAAALGVGRPGLVRGPRPERSESAPALGERVARRLQGLVGVPRTLRGRSVRALAARVDAAAVGLDALGDAALDERVAGLRKHLRRAGIDEALLPEAFALVRELAGRTLGTRHYDVQLAGGHIMALGGLAELETGEGKTLTATLPAAVAALAGIPVHVITSNDYLVERDAAAMSPLYARLGLRTGRVIEAEPEPERRREAYACDVTYVTNKQVAFDYLKDRLALGDGQRLSRRLSRPLASDEIESPQAVLRGLCFAIVDEADSVLIDDARTPLILSKSGAMPDVAAVRTALKLARSLEDGADFRIERRLGRIALSERGRERLADAPATGSFVGERRREEWVLRALSALHLFRRDVHYLVRDGAIEIIDQPTGRRSPDRSFEGGMQPLIEVKEGAEVTPERETIARISYQRFFRRYLRLAGMTGTAREVSQELWNVYGLATRRVPTRLPSQRRNVGMHLCATSDERLDRAARRIAELQAQGQPVLVGTADVETSEGLCTRLRERGLEPALLNASQDAEEAAVVARAGEAGRITVATRMAGRGTDIPLAEEVAAGSGLAVVATELSEAARIDRQLFGRCGRQGNPGCFEQWVSLEDPVLAARLPRPVARWLAACLAKGLSPRLLIPVTRWAQMAEERKGALTRRHLLEAERSLEEMLAFTGRTDR